MRYKYKKPMALSRGSALVRGVEFDAVHGNTYENWNIDEHTLSARLGKPPAPATFSFRSSIFTLNQK